MKQKKVKSLRFLSMLCVVLLGAIMQKVQTEASCGSNLLGYTCPGHGHSMTANSTCSNCGGSGYTAEIGGINGYSNYFGCTRCGGSGMRKVKNSTLEETYNSGYVKGKGYNRHCTNGTGCRYSSWNYYSSVSGICYTCSGCEPTYGEHEKSTEETCTVASYCKHCGGLMENALGHSGTGTWDYSEAGYQRELCSRCGEVLQRYVCSYTVTFNGNGGVSTVSSRTVTYDTGNWNLGASVASRSGYTFLGYYTASSGGSQVYDANGNAVNGSCWYGNGASAIWKYAGNITLYAQWTANQYTLTLHANGSKFSNGQTAYTLSPNLIYEAQNWITVPTISRTGYTFKGYYTAPSGGVQVYNASGRATNDGTYWKDNKYCYTGNCTVYAQWQKNNYTVTYDANGGSSVSQASASVNYDAMVNLNVTAEKEGYIFVGWNTSPDAKVPLESYNMSAGNVTLYAIYSIPVSDVKEVYLQAWIDGEEDEYRIYPLNITGQNMRGYNYKLDRTNVSADFSGAAVSCVVVAWDNAGNYNVLWGNSEPQIPDIYWQSVEHYYQDTVSGEWIRFAVVSEQRLAGEEYVPQYIVPSDGYEEHQIDAPYIVQGDTVTKAYYTPVNYTLFFDPHRGTCLTESKPIRGNEVYGELPTAEREGYTFLGWFTEQEGGNRIVSSDVYTFAGDSTVYAHWEAKTYTVQYDYLTNGGGSADKTAEQITYGTEVDLNVAAVKEGYEHIGWNTSPDATEGLSTLVIGNQDVILYAIYKKNVSVTFVDCRDIARTENFTLYNRTEQINIIIPAQNFWTGWQAEGWSLGSEADAEIDAAKGAEYTISEDTIFYGRYSRAVTVSYDTGDAGVEIPEEQKIRHYNASGQYQNPVFTLAQTPSRENYSFVSWKVGEEMGHAWEKQTETMFAPEQQNEAEYAPEQEVELQEDTLFVAVWDRYPEIESYDRYFTLAQAQNGEITPTVLLETVNGTDLEDGTLTNGTDVIVIYYQPQEFTTMTADGSISVTYQATDSFGNVTTKLVMAHVVDTSLRDNTKQTYSRFISEQFYQNEGEYVAAASGGLEENSVWKTNNVYNASLTYALSNSKVNEEIAQIEFFGKNYKIVKPGTGDWQHKEETWTFSKEQIQDMDEFITNTGYGNYKSDTGIADFYQQFSSCKE